MKLSNFERQQFANRVKSSREVNTKEVPLRTRVENFPGRVVSVNAALQRMRYRGMSMEEACLRPNESRKGRAKA